MEAAVTLEELKMELEDFAKGAMRDELSDVLRDLRLESSTRSVSAQVFGYRSVAPQPVGRLSTATRAGSNCATRASSPPMEGAQSARFGGCRQTSSDPCISEPISADASNGTKPFLDRQNPPSAIGMKRYGNQAMRKGLAQFAKSEGGAGGTLENQRRADPREPKLSRCWDVDELHVSEERPAEVHTSRRTLAEQPFRPRRKTVIECDSSSEASESVSLLLLGEDAAVHDSEKHPRASVLPSPSAQFEHFAGMLVVMNSMVLGWEAHYQAVHQGSPLPRAVHRIETVFCAIFILELMLRVRVLGRDFFKKDGRYWNAFDSVMVLLMIMDQLAEVFEDMQLPVSLSVVRVLRLLRLIRITRLIRVLHLFDELRTIVTSMSRSAGSLGWALLMVVMMIYVFSVLFLQVVADSGKLSDHESLQYWFGNLWRTSLTMFECIVGGVSWDEVIVPLMQDVSPIMGIVFCGYVTVAVFAMMNLVTGLFVENVAKTVREDKDILMALRITKVFMEGDMFRSGQEITYEEFAEKMESNVMQEYFKAIDVNPSEARNLFDLLDADGSGSVDADEIINGCLTLRGPAKSMDISILMRAVASMRASVDWQLDRLLEALDKNAFALDDVRANTPDEERDD